MLGKTAQAAPSIHLLSCTPLQCSPAPPPHALVARQIALTMMCTRQISLSEAKLHVLMTG